ncbi:MAG: allophanate hydrolase [Corallincola sp.]|nr:allophanate hydrolase [Corallincola sp.]
MSVTVTPGQPATIEQLLAAYRSGQLTPRQHLLALRQRAEAACRDWAIFTHLLSAAELEPWLAALEGQDPQRLPLYGVPFAIKDNIDLAGVPTTAGCPDFAYMPERSATVVVLLLAAGAVPLGKTHLDQFATGLVGQRAPACWGEGRNAFNPEWISGGSSSGSAVAVASGLVPFSLGTDTAGSGRVPAGFNNIVGFKPSKGRLSTLGVVPACRSLDCVSIFALTAADAARVEALVAKVDEADPYSRHLPQRLAPSQGLRVGVPKSEQRLFFGDAGYATAYEQSLQQAAALGWQLVEVDIEPLLAAARLLYEGPWVAERYAAVAELLERQPEALLPVISTIIGGGGALRAVDAFRSQYRLAALSRDAAALWSEIDLLLLPTAPTLPSRDAVRSQPIALNSQLGTYTNFVNLLDLAAIALPSQLLADGRPFGITLMMPAGNDQALLYLGEQWQQNLSLPLGATQLSLTGELRQQPLPEGYAELVVCGAHLSGLPLNGQLTSRGGLLREATTTAAEYRFVLLAGGPPQRPALVHVGEGGVAIEVEVWALPHAALGELLGLIPKPLALGRCKLVDGRWLTGFVGDASCEQGASNISQYGSWRAFVAAQTG